MSNAALGAIVADGLALDRLELADDPAQGRYAAAVDDAVLAISEYRRHDRVWYFTHTETDPAYEGRGLATLLVRFALDDIRGRGGSIVPFCPFVRAFLGRYPEYESLVDHDAWDRARARRDQQSEAPS